MVDTDDKQAYKEVTPSMTMLTQRLQTAVWHYVNQIIEQESDALNSSATPQFVSALADMVYTQAGPPPPYNTNVRNPRNGFRKFRGTCKKERY
jgi:CENP-S protein